MYPIEKIRPSWRCLTFCSARAILSSVERYAFAKHPLLLLANRVAARVHPHPVLTCRNAKLCLPQPTCQGTAVSAEHVPCRCVILRRPARPRRRRAGGPPRRPTPTRYTMRQYRCPFDYKSDVPGLTLLQKKILPAGDNDRMLLPDEGHAHRARVLAPPRTLRPARRTSGRTTALTPFFVDTPLGLPVPGHTPTAGRLRIPLNTSGEYTKRLRKKLI
jgi:hypothetical protein